MELKELRLKKNKIDKKLILKNFIYQNDDFGIDLPETLWNNNLL